MKTVIMGDRLHVSKGDKFVLVIGDNKVPAIYTEGGWCFDCPLFDSKCALWVSCNLDTSSDGPHSRQCHVRTLEDAVE